MSLPFLQPYFGLSNSLQTAQASAGGGVVGGWVELGRTTLGSAGDAITVSSLADKRYYMVLGDLRASGTIDPHMRLNSDTGNNYSYRYSDNGGADGTGTSSSIMLHGAGNSTTPQFAVSYLTNYSTKEKLLLNFAIVQNTAGAGNAPTRRESVSKHAQTSNPISVINSHNSGTGDYASGSEVVVLGWDPADTHTSNFWTELASTTISTTGDTFNTGTFTAKKYLWIQYYVTGTAPIRIFNRFGNGTVDTGNNYSTRRNINGTSEDTITTASGIAWIGANAAKSQFANLFVINNSANEKLVIGHLIDWATSGAGTAPNRKENVGKWTNTSNQANIFGIHNDDAGDITSGYIKVWGSD